MWNKLIKQQLLYTSKNYKINLVNISLGIIIAWASVRNLTSNSSQAVIIKDIFSEYLFCFGLYPMLIFSTLYKASIRLNDIYVTRSRNILLQQIVIQFLENLISILLPWVLTIELICQLKSLQFLIMKIEFIASFIYLILSFILIAIVTLLVYWLFFNKIISFIGSFVIVAILFYYYITWYSGILYNFELTITNWKVISEMIGIDILLFVLLEILVTQREIL